jgi:hypothetical protein
VIVLWLWIHTGLCGSSGRVASISRLCVTLLCVAWAAAYIHC